MASEVTNYGYFAKMGFNMLARRLDSNATVTMNAHDYMWGYEEPLIRLGNQIMPGWITYDKLGLLDRVSRKIYCFLTMFDLRNKFYSLKLLLVSLNEFENKS